MSESWPQVKSKYPAFGVLEVTDLERQFRKSPELAIEVALNSVRQRIVNIRPEQSTAEKSEILSLLMLTERKLKSLSKVERQENPKRISKS
jgi:hypothetical protein